MSPVCVPSQFGFSRSFINQPRLGVNHKTMIVKIKTTGLKGKPENITTQILSREEGGVAGRGSLRAERTTGTGGKKKVHSISGMMVVEKTIRILSSQPLYFTNEKREVHRGK